jgi:hypothetical protein
MLFGQLGQNQLAVTHPNQNVNLIEESMKDYNSPVNRVTESIDDLKERCELLEAITTVDSMGLPQPKRMAVEVALAIVYGLKNSSMGSLKCSEISLIDVLDFVVGALP